MKKELVLSNILVLLSAVWVFSQPAEENHVATGYGYIYGAPGVALAFCDCGNEATVAIGGGGEGLLKGGFGLGIDGGYFFSPTAGIEYGIGLISPSALYRFKPRSKINPFVLGGYTLAFRGGVANLVHFGGGVNYWLNQHWGLRVEVRYLMSPQYPGEAAALQFRVGALIR